MKKTTRDKELKYQFKGEKYIIFDDNFFEEFYPLIANEHLISFANEIFYFVKKEIIFCNNFISQVDSTEKDLVDLI